MENLPNPFLIPPSHTTLKKPGGAMPGIPCKLMRSGELRIFSNCVNGIRGR
jgi:hypothetical protein